MDESLFRPGASGTSLLALCARLCQISYERDPSKVVDGVTSAGLIFAVQFHDDATDTQGLICQHPTEPVMFVVFRGSDSFKDAVIDLAALPFGRVGTDDSWKAFAFHGCGARVHLGFAEAWASVREKVLSRVEHFYNADTRAKIVVTGHSLGAALATLAATEVGLLAPATAIHHLTLITFGSPRVGVPAFCRVCEDHIGARLRVVLEDDAITTVPVAPFAHIGPMLHLRRDGREIGPAGRGWRFIWRHLGRWLRMQWRQARSVMSGKAIEDHDIERYYGACRLHEGER